METLLWSVSTEWEEWLFSCQPTSEPSIKPGVIHEWMLPGLTTTETKRKEQPKTRTTIWKETTNNVICFTLEPFDWSNRRVCVCLSVRVSLQYSWVGPLWNGVMVCCLLLSYCEKTHCFHLKGRTPPTSCGQKWQYCLLQIWTLMCLICKYKSVGGKKWLFFSCQNQQKGLYYYRQVKCHVNGL